MNDRRWIGWLFFGFLSGFLQVFLIALLPQPLDVFEIAWVVIAMCFIFFLRQEALVLAVGSGLIMDLYRIERIPIHLITHLVVVGLLWIITRYGFTQRSYYGVVVITIAIHLTAWGIHEIARLICSDAGCGISPWPWFLVGHQWIWTICLVTMLVALMQSLTRWFLPTIPSSSRRVL